MQLLSPARACDPWAVLSAQALSQMNADYADLSESQAAILRALRETDGLEAAVGHAAAMWSRAMSGPEHRSSVPLMVGWSRELVGHAAVDVAKGQGW
ncbi:MAG: hypothetical protein KKA73_07835 [Chloroflexi bacterium]|nr:hypothetical protein [Chloroflexota bacterium]MBU1747583.1 hypothetical protein [Chloroflexota bacterium]